MTHLPVLVIAIIACCAEPPPAFGQETSEVASSSETTLEPSDRTLSILRRFLKREHGVDPAQVVSKIDLVLDLEIDPTDLYYSLLDLYEKLNIKPPSEDLTRVHDIALFIDNAPPPPPDYKSATAPKKEKTYIQSVFFTTNRNATNSKNPEKAFDGTRVKNHMLQYGLARVNIPLSHKKGRLETPLLRIRSWYNPKKHIFIDELEKFDRKEFFNALSDSKIDAKDLFVYVHGFNTTFDDAIRRTAQIAFDFEFRGFPIAFTWPSDGGGILSYTSDWQDVLWSVKYIENFLLDLKARFPKRKIHLIAHSMGNKGLLYALRLMANSQASDSLFSTVMLCAPDFDAELFIEQIAPEIRALAENWVVYSSEKDIALISSEKINAAPRLGRRATPAEGYQIIDATKLPVTPWSVPETHSYYASNKRVIDDMIKAIDGKSPAERGLEEHVVDAGSIWILQMPVQ